MSAASYKLTRTARLVISKGDITKWKGDAIVNAANELMLGGGGVDGAIHRAAGPKLVGACRKIPEVYPGVRCPTGDARITGAFKLGAKYVIHTVGPIFSSFETSTPLLASAYRRSMEEANKAGVVTIAFPAISCGVFRFPLKSAAEVAISMVKEHAGPQMEEVTFVLFSDDVVQAWQEAAEKLLAAPEQAEAEQGQCAAQDDESQQAGATENKQSPGVTSQGNS